MNLQSINASASPEVQVNENFETLDWGSVYGKDPRTTENLTWVYYGGRWSGFSVAGGIANAITLTDAATNYLVVARATGVLTASTVITNWNDTGNYARVYKLTTAGGVVTAVEDHRIGASGVFGIASDVVVGPASAVDGDLARFDGTTGKRLKAGIALSASGTLAENSDAVVATQKAVKTYADALLATADAMVYKGATDCSTNPNYPAADAGHTYRVSVAGKIGGASGKIVEVADWFICNTDATASGDEATVGTKWNVLQANLDGAVIGPASAVDGDIAVFDGTTGKLLKARAGAESGTWSADLGPAGTAARAAATIYQNTSGKKRRLMARVQGVIGGYCRFYIEIDSVSPPTSVIPVVDIIVNAPAGNAHSQTLTPEVPNNWYYRVTLVAGTVSVWHELDE